MYYHIRNNMSINIDITLDMYLVNTPLNIN